MTQKISADPTIGVRFLTHLFLLVPSDIISSVAMFRPVMPLPLVSGHKDSPDLYRLHGLPPVPAEIPAAGDLCPEELSAHL